MPSRGRHQTTCRECKAVLRRIEALEGVGGVIIGRSYGGKSLGAASATGTVRIQRLQGICFPQEAPERAIGSAWRAGKRVFISQKPLSPFFKFEQIGYQWYFSIQHATSENMLKSIFKLSSLSAAMALSCSAQNHYGKHLPKGLHGHFGTWYDSGASGNSPAGQSQSIPFWGSELVLSKKFYLQNFNLTLMNHQPLADAKEYNEFNIHFQWSRQINKNLILSLGLNNYYYPEFIDSVKAYHELETRIDYTFSSISSYFYVDQELQSNSYTYAALGASLAPIELGNCLSFTPSVELSAILRAGEVYTEAGLDNLALAGTLTYQMKESASQFYLILSANRGFSPEREKLALGFTIGLQINF